MNDKIKNAAKTVLAMDSHLRNDLLKKDGKLQTKKHWENTFIKHQIDRRKQGDTFSVEDHIRAMVYSMLSSGISWQRVESGIDNDTGKIIPIDEIFCQYDVKALLHSTPEELRDKIKELRCASLQTLAQMKALLEDNIPKLLAIEKQHGSIDNFYRHFINADPTLNTLVLVLSEKNSKYNLSQMGEALTAEYLRNVGYDISKPDRHIRRILGSKYLSCSESEIVPIYEAFDIVAEIASELGKSVAEVDYILWSYCANGYGEVCTLSKPGCDKCVAKEICNYKKGI